MFIWKILCGVGNAKSPRNQRFLRSAPHNPVDHITHPAFRSVGSLSRRSALFARSPRMAVRPSVLAKSIALGEFHHWLALAGTRVGLSSGILSFIRPPSCPPWLHGHYPLRSYYGDSDSCPAPSSTRTGLLDYRTCISGHSVSIHPMRPRLPAILLAPGGLGLRFALDRYRRFFGLRSFLAVSSVA